MNNPAKINSLTRTSLLAKNAAYNLVSQIAPLFAALIAIPILVRNLGAERFGVLGLAWVVLGYFGLFDLGLGRVLTKMIAEKLGEEQDNFIAPIIWSGLVFMFVLGLVVMLFLLMLTPVMVHSLLKIPQGLLDESFRAFLILTACVPIIILTTGLRAILEAYQLFGIVNIIRTANGVLLYVAPLVILPFTSSIHHVVLVLTLIRFSSLLVYLLACRRYIEPMRQRPNINKSLIKPMFKLGGWMSVSNIIGPVMVYFDRFLMGIWLSITAVAFYVTPYEVISKSMVITTSVVHVLFPAFSMSFHADPEKAAALYSRGNRVLLMLFFPITLTLVTFARPGMTLWLGPDFAEQGVKVLQWLAIGVMINAPGQVAFAAIQAAGRADWTAKLHIIESPFYLVSLFLFVQWFGIIGAAMAWTLRLFIETIILFFMAEQLLKDKILKNNLTKFSTVGAFLVLGTIIQLPILVNFVFYAILLTSSVFIFWFILVDKQERYDVKRLIFKNTKVGVQS